MDIVPEKNGAAKSKRGQRKEGKQEGQEFITKDWNQRRKMAEEVLFLLCFLPFKNKFI